jgi:hypothetical protein
MPIGYQFRYGGTYTLHFLKGTLVYNTDGHASHGRNGTHLSRLSGIHSVTWMFHTSHCVNSVTSYHRNRTYLSRPSSSYSATLMDAHFQLPQRLSTLQQRWTGLALPQRRPLSPFSTYSARRMEFPCIATIAQHLSITAYPASPPRDTDGFSFSIAATLL